MVILLVEDEIPVQFFIWNLLKADGFTVLTARDGVAALETSRNHPGPIDLLLTDVEMPRMDGLELSRMVVAERPGIKVLITSGGSWRERTGSNERIAIPSKTVHSSGPTGCDSIGARTNRAVIMTCQLPS